ncbi:MAG: DNA translocase FtsK, partial [Coprobacillaceae bacterium]
MAKTKRTKKSKQDQISEELKTRIIAAIGLFLIVIAAMKLGIIGEQLHYVSAFCVGNFVGILYIMLACLACYVIYFAKLPKYKGPKAVGLYLVVTAILIYISVPGDTSIVGIKVINQYMASVPLNRGGFIGAILYGGLSALFDHIGTVIAAIFILAIGLVLFGGKMYINYRNKRVANKKPKTKDVNKISTRTGKFIDFFSKKKDEDVFFSDNSFEEKKKRKKEKPVKSNVLEDNDANTQMRIHQMQMAEDEEVETTLDINDESMTLEIKEKTEVEPEPILKKVPKKINKNYKLPPLQLLKTVSGGNTKNNRGFALDNAKRLASVLQEFGVNASVSDIFIGPSVTKYELKLETGTRVNKILQLQDDIKLALAAKDIRIEAPIPGKAAVGVEIPNQSSTMVSFKEVFKDIPDDLQDNKLLVPLGKDVSGKAIYAELNKMPHLLIAGATGSGKSVCINTIICSILMRARPDEVRLILIDPKKVELSNYNGVPHLLAPVVTDPKKAANVLREVVGEMERRYDLFANANVRNIASYNAYAKQKNETLAEDEEGEILPYHVVILDEVADLMMVASKDVEDCIMRIAQMARAAGIHMIVATQRPSTDVITGVIKANIPSRIAFAVSSGIDSRTILDGSGAGKLLGKGDMLFSPMGSSSPTRVQGAFVSDDEVAKITYYTTQQQEATYEDKFVNVKATSPSTSSKEDEEDEEYEMCRTFVINAQKASTSLLQRQFRIGYNKAARIIDQLESDGIIGPQVGSKPREVYVRGY